MSSSRQWTRGRPARRRPWWPWVILALLWVLLSSCSQITHFDRFHGPDAGVQDAGMQDASMQDASMQDASTPLDAALPSD